MPSNDEWFDTGIISNYNGEIIDAWFATDAMTNEGKTMILFLKMVTDMEDLPEHEVRYNCGDGWESSDGGKTIQKVDNPNKDIHQNSMVAKMTKAAFDSGARDVLMERAGPLKARDSGIWLGLAFHWGTVVYDYGEKFAKQAGREDGKISRVVPTEFLGINALTGGSEYQGVTGTSPNPSQTAQDAPPAAQTPAYQEMTAEAYSALPEAFRTRVEEIAKANDQPQFLDSVIPALDEHGLMGNDGLIAYLADETTWKELHG